MTQISVDAELCKKDGICVAVCPARVLVVGADGLPEEVAGERCIHCGHCVAVCKSQALIHTGLEAEPMRAMPTELPAPQLLDGLLHSRRSIRVYREQPVPRAEMEAMLDVARCAPTATNSQRLHWIVVNGREQVQELAAEIVEGLRQAGVNPSILQQWESGYDFALRGAPTVAVVCAPQEYYWGREDGATALTFLELAAEARGYGVCWAGYLTRCAGRHEPLRRKLGVPEGMAVCGGLMMGRSLYKYHRVPSRKPLSVQWN